MSAEGFRTWMRAVDRATFELAGISISDLPDQPFRDTWESGTSPREFAQEALAAEGFPEDGLL